MKDKTRRLVFAASGTIGIVSSIKLITATEQLAMVLVLAVLNVFISIVFITWAFEGN